MTILAMSFLGYSLVIAAFGLLSARFARATESDFLLADRGLGAWVGALSASASAESGFVTLGLVGIAFTDGLFALWIVPGTVAAFIFNWVFLAPRLQQASHEQGALTLTDVLAMPHSRGIATLIRIVAMLMILAMLTGYVAAQFNAAGVAFAGSFGWDYSTGVLVGSGLVLAYTVTGGFRAVAWTDVLQAIVMIVAVVAVPLLLIRLIGGPGEFVSQVQATPELMDPFKGRRGAAAALVAMSLLVGVPLGNTGQPHVLVRLMALKDATARRRAAVISTLWVAVLFSGAIAVGMAARIYYGPVTADSALQSAEKALPFIAADAGVVHPIVGGMLVAAVLAAICSTADSQLLVAASSVSHDFLVRVVGLSPALHVRKRLDRTCVVVVGLVATGIALGEVRSVFHFVLAAWDGLGATFGPALLLTFLFPRVTGPGVLAAMLTGGVTAVVWRWFPDLQATVYGLIPAFGAACLVGCVVSLLTSPAPDSGQAAA